MNQGPDVADASGEPVQGIVLRDEAELLDEFARGAKPGALARQYLDTVRTELFRRHVAGAGGLEIVREFTTALDHLLRALYRYADAEHSKRFPRLNQRLTAIARGGYGRAELNPY